MDLGITGRRALVCASSQGLGQACALALAQEGCEVFINGRQADKLERAAARLREATGARVHAVVADLNGREFTMEESHDGQRIDATWLGTAVPGHCGRLVRGERLATDGSSQGFTMRPAR